MDAMERARAHRPWFTIEQEYTLLDGDRCGTFPAVPSDSDAFQTHTWLEQLRPRAPCILASCKPPPCLQLLL